MEEIHDYDDTCERYLLGELSEQEQVQLEEAYFADDALFERFRAVKDDLIDAYVRGELAGEKRQRFEHHFLDSQPRQQRVAEAREFIRAVTAASMNAATITADDFVRSRQTGWRQLLTGTFAFRPWVLRGALAVLVLVSLAGSWMFVRRFQSERAEEQRLQNEARRQREQERVRAAAPPVNSSGPQTNPTASPEPDSTPQPKTSDKQTPQPVPAQVASLFLSPFSPRASTASNSLLLRPDTGKVRLHLAFTGDDYRRYDVLLRTLDGEQVLSRRGLQARSSKGGKSVIITLDPSILQRQDYIITLNALTSDGKLEAIGDYYFRVERSTPQSPPTPARP